MNEEKTKGQQLQELLFNKRENGVDFMDDAELGVCDDFVRGTRTSSITAKPSERPLPRHWTRRGLPGSCPLTNSATSWSRAPRYTR